MCVCVCILFQILFHNRVNGSFLVFILIVELAQLVRNYSWALPSTHSQHTHTHLTYRASHTHHLNFKFTNLSAKSQVIQEILKI